MPVYDYIVIGAGSAGCVLANRLSADPAVRVLLIEAGGRDRHPFIRIPLMTGVMLRGRANNWFLTTEPVPGLDGRRLFWPRGKVLGGSSAINGMVYSRGLPSDYDTWAQLGLPGWGFDDVLPYFKRSERFEGPESERHGTAGALDVTRPNTPHPLYDAFLAAGSQAGFPQTDDFNGPEPEGFGRYHFNIAGGRRVSSAHAFLAPVRQRANLTVATGALVGHILIEGGRAAAVEIDRGMGIERAAAAREIVLAAGTVGSPCILLRSGIGPGEELRPLGIPVRHDLPGVGRNLQDHLLARVQHACTQPITMHNLMRLDRAALAVLRAWAFGTGPAANFPLQAGAFLKSDPALSYPDIQAHFLPGLSTAALRWRPGASGGHGFFANCYQMRPESRGKIRLRSADPADAPLIEPNYLATATDMRVLRAGIRILRQVFAQPAFAAFRGPELAPGPAVRSDAELDAWLRATADTVFHPVGTCAMGARDDAVVDAALRVRGIDGLRVADASVMPRITSSNTHAPAVMIAEKAAALMLGA